jgi:hypothetical protein
LTRIPKVPFLAVLFVLLGCRTSTEPGDSPSREDTIPDDAVKMTEETDLHPPVIHSPDWEEPVPMEGPVNTAGAEDAPVISRDGGTFYFFFTPDVDVPPEEQVLDGVTGIWVSSREGDAWSEPRRVLLGHGLALDGPLCLQGDTLWFASFREGNHGENGDIWIAVRENWTFSDPQNAGSTLNVEYDVGELYTDGEGDRMILHRVGFGGLGGYDLFESERIGGEWTEPGSLGDGVNTELDEGWPFLSTDGNELWFTRLSELGYAGPALFRTTRTEDGWSEPEEIVSNFAGDPAVDDLGNLYFTHHFYDEDMNMIEADIYVARKRQ